jgi:hypothetical protein
MLHDLVQVPGKVFFAGEAHARVEVRDEVYKRAVAGAPQALQPQHAFILLNAEAQGYFFVRVDPGDLDAMVDGLYALIVHLVAKAQPIIQACADGLLDNGCTDPFLPHQEIFVLQFVGCLTDRITRNAQPFGQLYFLG